TPSEQLPCVGLVEDVPQQFRTREAQDVDWRRSFCPACSYVPSFSHLFAPAKVWFPSHMTHAASNDSSSVPVFLEASDVARALRVSLSTVRAYIAAGKLRPSGRTRRGVRLFDAAEVARARRPRRRSISRPAMGETA